MALLSALPLELREQIYHYCWFGTRYVFEENGMYMVATYHSTVPRHPFLNYCKNESDTFDSVPMWTTTCKDMFWDALHQFYRYAICHSFTSIDTITHYQPNWIAGIGHRGFQTSSGIFQLGKIQRFVLNRPGLSLGANMMLDETRQWAGDVDFRPFARKERNFDNAALKDWEYTNSKEGGRGKTLRLKISFEFNSWWSADMNYYLSHEQFQPHISIDLSYLEGWKNEFSQVEFGICVPQHIGRYEANYKMVQEKIFPVLLAKLKATAFGLIGTENCDVLFWTKSFRWGTNWDGSYRNCQEYWCLKVSDNSKGKRRNETNHERDWRDMVESVIEAGWRIEEI